MLQSARVEPPCFEDRSSGRHFIKSLGGCLTASVMQTCHLHAGIQHRHYWRRPTLALMGQPFGEVPEWPDYIPPFLVKYLGKDMGKDHLRQLVDGPCDVLVFDITRDVLQNVMDFGGDRMITDPLSLRGWSYDADRPDRADLDAIFGKPYTIRTYEDPDFFGLYEHFFDLFVASARCFDRVVINRIYYTDRIASRVEESFGDAGLVKRVNRFLDRAYHHIERYYPEIAWNSVDARFMLSSDSAPYGLFHTHYISESVGLLADGVATLALGRRYRPGRVFQDVVLASALDRLDHEREIQRQLAGAEAARAETSAEAEALRGERDAARAEAEHLRAERDAGAVEAEQQARERVLVETELARVRAQLDERAAETEVLAGRLAAVEAEAGPGRDEPATHPDAAAGPGDGIDARNRPEDRFADRAA